MKTYSFLVLACIASFFACDAITNCPECMPPPPELRLKLVDAQSHEDLVFADAIHADTVVFYLYKNNERLKIEPQIYLDTAQQTAYFYSYDICMASLQGTKQFFLYLGHNNVDTIQLDIREQDSECCLSYQWLEFLIQGDPVDIDSKDYTYVHAIATDTNK